MIESENCALLVRVWLLGAFHAERRKDDGTWEAIEKTAWENSYARPLLKRLLCATDRRVARSDLLDDLWPNTPDHLAEKYLNNASSKLRQVFHKQIIKPFGPHGISGYQLAEPSLLWTDIDACEVLMREAERIGLPSAEALPLLEQASKHFERGGVLEGESGQWCLAIRTQKEAAMRYCRILLAESYEAQNMLWQARSQYQKLLETSPIDEDVLCRLMAFLHRHGMTHDARACYEQAKNRFPEYSLSLSQATKKLAEKLMSESPPFNIYLAPPATKLLSSNTRTQHQPLIQLAHASFITYNNAKSLSSLPDLDMLMRSRRQVLKEILNAACAALALSPYALLPQDSRERLEMITAHPSYMDEEALGDLAAITQRYWGLSKNASIDLLSGIAGHFTTVTQLLQESHPTSTYEQLCALASENALLLGKTFHDIREYDLAWEYYKFSLKIAQDTQNTDLWANGVGRIALLLIYWGQPQNALPLLHEALKKEIHNQRLRPWLSAIEAEIHAMMGNVDDCLRSLEESRKVPLPISLADDVYATGFNPSRAAGYEGACFVRLRQPERALPALEEAFALCDPTSLRRRSTLLADIGTVHAQLGDVKIACSFILQSLDMTVQTKSLVVLQRIYKGRGELDPWKDSAEVQNLDERVSEMFTTLTKLKEHV